MPLFAKFLAFLNVVAACGFLYLATLDFNARRPWAYEVFRSELAVDGLPLDEHDPGPRRVFGDAALFTDLDGDTATLKDLFANAAGDPPAGGQFIRTQVEEVERLKDMVSADLDKVKDEDAMREKLRDYILPLASTLEERDYWAKRIDDKDADLKQLQKVKDDFIAEFFDRALKKDDEDVPHEKSDWIAQKKPEDAKPERFSRPTRRQLIAHVLYNLSNSPENHRRVMVVIGLRSYIDEAESQAARLREMALRTRMTMVEERGQFEVEHQRLVQRIYSLLEELESKKLVHADKVGIKKRTEELVKIRTADLADLKERLSVANQAIDTALGEQQTLERQLFDTQKLLGDVQVKAEEVQHRVRRMEGVGAR